MHYPQFDRATQTSTLRRRRISRWVVLLSVPLLLLSMLVMSMRDWTVAQAATQFIQVGDCVGTDHPITTTIQAAVNAAVSDTVIHICPGTYNESVNLSLMSSIGTITLRRLPGQTGDVLISAAISPSIWITYGSTFTGNVTLESLKVKADTNYGIDFASSGSEILGNIVLSDVTANENFYGGAYLKALGNSMIVNSAFNDNLARGLLLFGSQNIDIINSQANNNGDIAAPGSDGTGIALYAGGFCAAEVAATAYTVNVNGVAAVENQGWGIEIESPWDTNIHATEVYSNAYDGLFADVGFCETANLTVTDSIAEYNGTAEAYFPDTVSTEEFFDWGGFRLLTNGTLSIRGSEANENPGFGYCYYSDSYETPYVEVQDSSAAENTGEGFLYTPACEDYGGVRKLGEEGEGEVNDEVNDEVNGLVLMQPTLLITNSSAISNGDAGGFVFLDERYTITLTNISALENTNGVFFGDYPLRDAGVDASIAVDLAVSILPPTLIQDSLIQGNVSNGIVYTQSAFLSMGSIGVTADFTSTNTVESSIICENETGLRAEQAELLAGSVGIQAPPELALLVDAHGNWWGSTTGPTHTDNPDGTGDSIVEALTVEILAYEVDVAYDPWIDTIDDSATPNPTLLGIPVNVEYQFRDSASTHFLENGVGDPNNGPLFSLSATNGTVSGDAEKFIVNSLIEGTVNPTAAGTLTIELDGPCGLDSTQEIFVATPGIAVDKSPAAQGVAAGDSALFTITVSNSGNITLTDISVTDLLAPNCARATGALGNLGMGASTSYTCELPNVTNNLDNTVLAQGFALIDGSAAGSPVSANDSAQVFVASLELTKTVFVDSYNELIGEGTFNPSDCALSSNITVPVSTTVKYCYSVTNTGDYTVSTHSLVDSDFASPIFSNLPLELGPGESFSTVEGSIDVTKTLTVSVTNIATWRAEIAAPVAGLEADAVNVSLPVVATAQATVTISPDDLDQDEDGIPDNVEGTGDPDEDGIPAFLDPAGPTNEPPTQQPGEKEDLFLPSVNSND